MDAIRTIMKTRMLLLPLVSALLWSCSNLYTVTLNERIVYNPNAEPGDHLLADPNLQGCLNQTLSSSQLEDPADITLLACPSAGIESLVGIQNLSNLEQLDLSDNAITDLSPLAGLKKLRVLSIPNNDVRSVTALMGLPILRFVTLQGNEAIACRQLDNLHEKIGNSLNRPANCTR